MSKGPKPGQRVAHKELDSDNHEGARSGVVQKVVGDDKQKLVVIEGEDGKKEAYDTRELVALGNAKSSDGPVILKPHHLVPHLRRSPVILLVLLQLAVSAAIIVVAFFTDLPQKTLVPVILALLALPFLGILLLKREITNKD